MTIRQGIGTWIAAALLSGAAGCATTSGGDARDPAEGFNRAMFSFNDSFDQAIGKPVATAYRDVVPEMGRYWVRNFFANIADLWIGANNLLQGKPLDAVTDWGRFAFNSTIGLFGINDVASEMGIEKHDEDFGQTFGRWGVGDGPYLVWPLIGSSTVRDSAGLVLDFHFDPVLQHDPRGVRYAATVLRATSKRADLLDASRILEEAALDKYVFQRDAYLQRRRSLIYDGNPPRASREVHRAEEPAPAAPRSEVAPAKAAAIAPRAAVPSAHLDTAIRLLEEPAQPQAGNVSSHVSGTGG
ncbi:MAG TPA: VacJ family lipoprotein [Burkholderiales bacterium]|nr:VacJ family lipoprotein [Burkholderiales bacterium]